MGTAQLVFEGVLPEVTWPEVTSVTWQEVTSVTWLEVTSITCHVRKYVLRMRNRLRNIYPSGAFWPEVTKSPDRKRPCPEVVLTRSMFYACPAFSPRFFLSSSNMATGCDRRSLDPFGVPLGVCMRNRKLRNTRSDRRSRDPFGSVIEVFSTTSASYNHRKPRVLYLAWLPELPTHVLYLAMWLELALVICPLLFSYSVYIGCVVLQGCPSPMTFYELALIIFFFLSFLLFILSFFFFSYNMFHK
jgi:hypothetical protein